MDPHSRSPTRVGGRRPPRLGDPGVLNAQRLQARRADASPACARETHRTEVEALLPPLVLQSLQAEQIGLAEFAGPEPACSPAFLELVRSKGWGSLLRAAAAALVVPPDSAACSLALWQVERELHACNPRMPLEVHAAVGRTPPAGRTDAGPSPKQEIQLIQSLLDEGMPVAKVEHLLDSVAASRARAAVGPGSGPTYASHQRMIEWACSLFGAPPVPAPTRLVRRVAALVNSPSTLRGWLAAWRDVHIQRDVPWVGDVDPLLRRMRVGTGKAAPPPPEKKRLRLPHLRKVLQSAASRGEFRLGAAILIAYMFGLRVPSELLAQVVWGKLRRGRQDLTIVGLKRKGKPALSNLTRLCVCSSDELLCWHLWLQALQEYHESSGEADKFFPFSVHHYTQGLRQLLAAAGVAGGELHLWTSHCARRGSGADVLAAEGPLPIALGGGHRRRCRGSSGLVGMLAHGEWSTKFSASHYATLDEMDRHALAQAIALASDSD